MKKTFTIFLAVIIIFIFKTNIVTAQVNTQDSLALVALYNNTNGSGWTYSTHWLTATPVSAWYGISVTENRVSSIFLANNHLTGYIPPEIGNLTSLTVLSLYNNHLRGAIPRQIGNLTKLTALALNHNYLRSIPSEIGNLINLPSLALDHNRLIGTIPPEIGNLTKLSSLNLRGNQLSGSIPSQIGNLINLHFLYLQGNQLTGSIPLEIGNLTGLSELDLHNNQLSGSIPSEIGKLTHLRELYLQNNQLSGSIPSEIGNLVSLHYLYLNDNQLGGTIPGITPARLRTGKHMYLNNNKFTFLGMERIARNFRHAIYSFQASIPLYKNGKTLFVSHIGNLPYHNTYHWYKDGILFKTNIGDSTFHPKIKGTYNVTISNSVARQLTLYSNAVYYNGDDSIVDVHINEQDSLGLAALYNSTDGINWLRSTNWLTNAPVSTWYGVSVANNRVSGLNLSSNYLKGNIPPELGNLTGLTTLVLGSNKLSGNIPTEIGNLTDLTVLDFARCSELNGSIPAEIGNLTKLIRLNFRNNLLTGSIPVEIGNLINLKSLSFEGNQLTGSIPAEIGNFTSLDTLSLDYNRLSGKIPSEISNLTSLNWLDLESNFFTFAGMEEVENTFSHISFLVYYQQANIPLNITGNTLSVSAGGVLSHNTYKWYNSGSLVSTITGDSTFHPATDGVYHVTVTNSVATQLTLYSTTVNYVANDNLIASQTSELNNGNKLSAINIYPNPAKNYATLAFNANGKYTIFVSDVSGKTLQTKTGIAIKGLNIIQLDVSRYASGIYLITIIDEKNKHQTLRLIKE